MRVLYVSPYPPAPDGIGVYTQVLAGAVRAPGHDVAVLAAHPAPGWSPEVVGALAIRSLTKDVRDAVASFAPDVVHLQFAVPAFGAKSLAVTRLLDELSRLSVPVTVTMHEVTRDTALLRGPGRTLYRRIAARCDKIIVHTRAARETLTGALGVPPEKTVVIPHFSVRPPAAKSTPDELRLRFDLGGSRILLAFGFIHVDKGLDDLVTALSILRREWPETLRDVRLVVAGAVRSRRGPFRVFQLRDEVHFLSVQRMVRAMGLDDHFVSTGYVPDGDIGAWFEAAEAVVLPYRTAEQSGVANLATAYGVPVIATAVGGLADMFTASPWMAPPGAPGRLAAVIGRFLRETPVGHDHGGSAEPAQAASSKTTDLETVVRETLGVYRAIRRSTVQPTRGRTPGAA
ncbi:glycosyltransferase [Planotetraspora sp. GP83]|uniref:glycosyltransferase n=1 Tax=Planotetraspora sp. GP83 TaxID=3156264 RepID=UPI0035193670